MKEKSRMKISTKTASTYLCSRFDDDTSIDGIMVDRKELTQIESVHKTRLVFLSILFFFATKQNLTQLQTKSFLFGPKKKASIICFVFLKSHANERHVEILMASDRKRKKKHEKKQGREKTKINPAISFDGDGWLSK